MSGSGQRVSLEDAEYIAETLHHELSDYCEQIIIAGSIRRRTPTCGDIDLVCVPKLAEVRDLFDEEAEPRDLLHEGLNRLLAEGQIAKRMNAAGSPSSWGPSIKRAVYGGMPVDIQSVADPDALGSWLLIRTGPADFNKLLVTHRYKGGALPNHLEWKNGFQLWAYQERIPTPTEASVFEALELSYREPWQRG